MKKIFKNRYVVFLIILLNISLIILAFYYNYLIGIICFFAIFFSFVGLLKKCFNINFFNLSKLKNVLISLRIRKKIGSNERYMDKLKIETFDGSCSTTHPCILYFDNGFSGYKYWMVHTPYDNDNIEYENPSISVSNDGVHFITPNKVKNPLLPIIKKEGDILKYYNDSFFLYDNNSMQIWYRYTEECKNGYKKELINKIFRIVSKDGINYSKPELMIDNDGIWYLSPSIIKIYSTYYMYYFDKDLKCYCKTSIDLKKWSIPKTVLVEKYYNNFWHGEVKKNGKKIYFLYLSKNNELYLAVSDISNPFDFKEYQKIHLNYYDNSNVYGDYHPYKSSFIVDNNYFNIYVPYRVEKIKWFRIKGVKYAKWTMTNTFLKHRNFDKFVKKR